MRVLLPKNYHTEPARRFPVVYLLDGQNLFEAHTAAFRHWRLIPFMSRQPLKRQAILVGIDHGGIDRIHEYAPFPRGAQGGGQGNDFLLAIEKALKPFIDHTYRTLPQRETTGIAGASMGGLLAFYAGIRFGHVFGKIGVLSPSLWFNPQVLAWAENGASGAKSRFYVCGSQTESRFMRQSLEKVYWSLKKAGYTDEEIQVVVRNKGRHSETFWASEFKQMYEWFWS